MVSHEAKEEDFGHEQSTHKLETKAIATMTHPSKGTEKSNVTFGSKTMKSQDCGVCGQSFPTARNLKRHKLIHLGVKPFLCDFCGKSFSREENLKRHETVHSGEKPFACDFCGRSFRQKGDLKVHKRLHTGEKPFNCDTCGKPFSDRSTLAKHRKSHNH